MAGSVFPLTKHDDVGAPRTAIDPFLFVSGAPLPAGVPGPEKDKRTFSNTAKCDPAIFSLMKVPIVLAPNWESAIRLPHPPANSSQRTQQEINLLLSYKDLRTPERLDRIRNEIELVKTADFGGQTTRCSRSTSVSLSRPRSSALRQPSSGST